jgi:photosystem II stability/assembly factor-like uncharacterized protein
MKYGVALLIVVGCGSTNTSGNTGPTPNDAGDGDAASDVAEPADADADVNTPCERAILSAKWKVLPNAPTVPQGKQDDIYFLDANNGWLASGPKFALYKTTNGGDSWAPSFTSNGTFFRAVLFSDPMHGFAGNLGAGLDSHITDTNVLYATTNGGGTWQPVPSPSITGAPASGVCNFTALDSNHLTAVGRANGPANLVASSNGGVTWQSIDLSGTFSMVVDAYFTSPTTGFVIGMDNHGFANVAQTTDGGQHFTPKFTSRTPNSLSWKVSFPSAMVGYVAIQDLTSGPPTFAKTTDGGNHWSELPLNGVKTLNGNVFPAIGVGFITEKVGWISPEDPSLPTYVTSDGGNTWSEDPSLKSPINRFRFVDQKTAYAVGASVWKLSITCP